MTRYNSEYVEVLKKDHPRNQHMSKLNFSHICFKDGAYWTDKKVIYDGVAYTAKIFNVNSEDEEKHVLRCTSSLADTLCHCNIVQSFGAFAGESFKPYIVVEHLEISLYDFLRKSSVNRLVPLGTLRKIIHGIACGLSYLHGFNPPFVLKYLTARSVYLDVGMTAKIGNIFMGHLAHESLMEEYAVSGYMAPEMQSKT